MFATYRRRDGRQEAVNLDQVSGITCKDSDIAIIELVDDTMIPTIETVDDLVARFNSVRPKTFLRLTGDDGDPLVVQISRIEVMWPLGDGTQIALGSGDEITCTESLDEVLRRIE